MGTALAIAEFGQVLRGLGVRVSSTELMDAAAALLHVDWSDKSQFRAALQATLIKRADDVVVFDHAFRVFFGPEDAAGGTAPAGQDTANDADADAELSFQGQPLAIPDELKQVYGKIPEQDRQRIREFLAKTSGGVNVQTGFQPLAERMVAGSLEYWRRQLAEQEEQVYPARLTGDSRIDKAISASAQELGSSLQALLHRDLQRVGDHEIPLVNKLIKRMTRALASQISRRERQSHLVRRLDLRRTIRRNLRYGGVMLKLKYRTRSETKPKILLLCDVSGSMARYVVFVLQFLYGLASVVYNIESFVFADNLERLTGKFRRHQPFNAVMSQIMAGSGQWGKGTNLYDSLVALRRDYGRLVQPATVVIILSDTKTLQGENAAAELAKLGQEVKRVIWLNTLPASEWPRHKTTALFSQSSHMVPCNTLADLAGIVRAELFRLR